MYYALAIGLSDELFISLKTKLAQYGLQLIESSNIREANRLLNENIFHLLIANLEYLRDIQQIDWISNIRHISFAPVVVLTNSPEQDTSYMIDLGVDMCVSNKEPHARIADLLHAQFRRYTEYNHYDDPSSVEIVPFQVGDIFIDPPRRVVEVKGRSVELRPREFSLLLYFMRNPDIVLTTEQICERAWGMDNGYDHGISQPIYLLRHAIEPDPEKPIYIQTVYRTGYRFTANKVETCDTCEKSVRLL